MEKDETRQSDAGEPEEQEEQERTRALANKARDGDPGSFRVLYERIAPSLHTWAEIRIGPELRTCIDPEDVVQEVWCRAWRSMSTFDAEQGNFRYWVFRIAKNVLLEAHRRRRTAGAQTPGGATARLLALQEVPEDATALSQRVARSEGHRKLSEWFATLDPEDRELAICCGVEALPHADVSRRMNLGREAVSKRWQRLRGKLRELGLLRELFLGEVA